MTPVRRYNIMRSGADLLRALNNLVRRFPASLERAVGTGLLAGLHVQTHVQVLGPGGLEERCRFLAGPGLSFPLRPLVPT
jgi:hypothetical protein